MHLLRVHCFLNGALVLLRDRYVVTDPLPSQSPNPLSHQHTYLAAYEQIRLSLMHEEVCILKMIVGACITIRC